MTVEWTSIVSALGRAEESDEFKHLVLKISEAPVTSSTPKEYNDPAGDTKFYQFMKSGIEVGFRISRLNHVHMFLEGRDGYDKYGGPLPDGISACQSEKKVVDLLGVPSKTGGGRSSGMLGYVDRWIRYDSSNYLIRFEFSKNDELKKISLILP